MESIKYFTYLIAFLSAFFIILSIYILYNLYPNKHHNESKPKNIIEHFVTSNSNNSSNITNITSDASDNEEYTIISDDTDTNANNNTIPKLNDLHMMLNTYKNNTNIENDALRWYNTTIDIKNILTTDYNTSSYFNYNNPLKLLNDKIFYSVKGAALKDVEMTGPLALYFANNDKSYELNEFSMLFMCKFNKIEGFSTLVEMICNSISINDKKDKFDNTIYKASVISINVVSENENKMKFNIVIGSNYYEITGIDKNLIISDDIVLLCLSVNNNYVTLTINSKQYKTNNTNTDKITLGSAPFVMNKYGDIDMVLYSFAFYKTFFNENDIVAFKKYNNYYITGIYKLIEDNKQQNKKIENIKKDRENKQKLLLNTAKLLDKCTTSSSESMEYNNLDSQGIEALSITPLKKLLPSKM